MAEAFRALKIRNFRLFVTGQLVSLMGMWMQVTAIDWLVLQLSGDSGTALGLVLTLQFTPFLLFTLYGGKLADRYDKRAILLIANSLWLVLSTTLAILVITDAVRLWQVYVFAATLGTISAVEGPTRQAFVSELANGDLLPNALALQSATFNASRTIGPAIAGGLIALVGTGPVIAINAATYLGPVLALLAINASLLHRSARRRSGNGGVRDGLRYVRRRPDLILPLVLMFVVGGIGFNFPITLALMAKTEFGTGAESFGLLNTALAFGALCAAIISGKRHGRPGVYVVIAAAAAFGALEAVVGFSPTFTVAMLLLLPTGFAMVYLAQAVNQRIQLGTHPEYRGRVVSLYMLVFIGSTPLFAPLIGWISELTGARTGLWIGGAASVAAAVAAFAVRCQIRDVRVRVRMRRPYLDLTEPVRLPTRQIGVEDTAPVKQPA